MFPLKRLATHICKLKSSGVTLKLIVCGCLIVRIKSQLLSLHAIIVADITLKQLWYILQSPKHIYQLNILIVYKFAAFPEIFPDKCPSPRLSCLIVHKTD